MLAASCWLAVDSSTPLCPSLAVEGGDGRATRVGATLNESAVDGESVWCRRWQLVIGGGADVSLCASGVSRTISTWPTLALSLDSSECHGESSVFQQTFKRARATPLRGRGAHGAS